MEEVKIKKKNALDVSVKVLKIISLILFCVITIVYLFSYYIPHRATGENAKKLPKNPKIFR